MWAQWLCRSDEIDQVEERLGGDWDAVRSVLGGNFLPGYRADQLVADNPGAEVRR